MATPDDDETPDSRRTLEHILSRGRARLAAKIVAAAVVGLCVWVAVNALSPSTLVDTTTDEDDARAPTLGDVEEPIGSTETEDGAEAIVVEAAGQESRGEDAEDSPVETVDEGEESQSSSLDYQTNLELIQASSVRNDNHDDSPYVDTPSASLVLEDHYGPRTDYLGTPAGNPENAFPIPAGGQFRAGCEFSHFTYDDPLVFPGRPGASHLHMHFGNTHVNAFTTYETLIDSGSSTCNGQELNRTGYWVPALFDGEGNVRIPERVVVYYKGEGRANGASEVYPEGAAMIASENINTLPVDEGGVGGNKLTFLCTDNFSSQTDTGDQTMPSCDGSRYGADSTKWVVLEMNVKFPQCWNGEEPGDWENFQPPSGDWYGSRCDGAFNRTLPNMEYFVNYRVEAGENTADWFLSSDVDPTAFGTAKADGGSTSHGDWWGGWHSEVNELWVKNCVNFSSSAPSGCGRGYLTDGGPDGNNPRPGPALKIRPQYEGPNKVPAETLLKELCPDPDKAYGKPEDAAYCIPGEGL